MLGSFTSLSKVFITSMCLLLGSVWVYSVPLLAKVQMLKSPKIPLPNQQVDKLKCGYKRKEITFKDPIKPTEEQTIRLSECRIGTDHTRCAEYEPKIPLIALTPKSNIGLTVDAYPKLLFYIPDVKVEKVIVKLSSENGDLYMKTIPITKTDNIISVNFSGSPSLAPLEVGKRYFWLVAIISDSSDREPDGEPVVVGWIQRVELTSGLKQKLDNALPKERPAIYAANGIWYNALASLAELRCSSPDDRTLVSDWKSLLQQVELSQIDSKPLEQCQTTLAKGNYNAQAKR